MTADPSAFDRLVLAAVGAPTAAPETAGDLAVLMVEAERLRQELATTTAERERWRRIAMDQAERLATYASADVARDRIQPPKAWGIDPGEVE